MEGTIAEIHMWAASFSPRNWLYCNGQIMSIAQNTAMFSLLGTTYGGNGQTTFAIPDLRSRVPVGTGQAPGLTNYQLGQVTGTETNTITAANIPAHTHALGGTAKMLTTNVAGNAPAPGGNYFANDGSTKYKSTGGGGTFKPATVALSLGASGGTPVNNIMPYTGISYIICQFGIFPSRN